MTDNVDSRVLGRAFGTAGSFDKAHLVAEVLKLAGDELRAVFVVFTGRVDGGRLRSHSTISSAGKDLQLMSSFAPSSSYSGQEDLVLTAEPNITHAANPERIAFSTASQNVSISDRVV